MINDYVVIRFFKFIFKGGKILYFFYYRSIIFKLIRFENKCINFRKCLKNEFIFHIKENILIFKISFVISFVPINIQIVFKFIWQV